MLRRLLPLFALLALFACGDPDLAAPSRSGAAQSAAAAAFSEDDVSDAMLLAQRGLLLGARGDRVLANREAVVAELRRQTAALELESARSEVPGARQLTQAITTGIIIDNGIRLGRFAIHGTAGDTALQFNLQPSPAAASPSNVWINLRIGGASLGTLPAPPGGWRTPLSMKLYDLHRTGLFRVSGRGILLDAQTQPVDIPSNNWVSPKIYEYSYSFSPSAGFSSTLLATHVLPAAAVAPPGSQPAWVPGSGFVFAGSIALLPAPAGATPEVVVTDNFNGLYCSSAGLTTYTLCLLDTRFGGGLRQGRILGTGPDRLYQFLVPGGPGLPPDTGIYPGAHSIAYHEGTDSIYFSVTYSGGINPMGAFYYNQQATGIHGIARTDLLSTAIPPFAKSGDPFFGGVAVRSFRTVVSGVPGFGDLTDGMDTDRFNPSSPWLYWLRAPSDAGNIGCPNASALRRVNLFTGATELVVCDATLLAWTNEISTAPGVLGLPHITNVLPSVGQEYNNPFVNVLLLGTESYFTPRMPTVFAPF